MGFILKNCSWISWRARNSFRNSLENYSKDFFRNFLKEFLFQKLLQGLGNLSKNSFVNSSKYSYGKDVGFLAFSQKYLQVFLQKKSKIFDRGFLRYCVISQKVLLGIPPGYFSPGFAPTVSSGSVPAASSEIPPGILQYSHVMYKFFQCKEPSK